jgi:hypothetical protein
LKKKELTGSADFTRKKCVFINLPGRFEMRCSESVMDAVLLESITIAALNNGALFILHELGTIRAAEVKSFAAPENTKAFFCQKM